MKTFETVSFDVNFHLHDVSKIPNQNEKLREVRDGLLNESLFFTLCVVVCRFGSVLNVYIKRWVQ